MENKISPYEDRWRKYELWRYNLKFHSYKGLSASVTMCTLVVPKSVLGPDPSHFSYVFNSLLDINEISYRFLRYIIIQFVISPPNHKIYSKNLDIILNIFYLSSIFNCHKDLDKDSINSKPLSRIQTWQVLSI